MKIQNGKRNNEPFHFNEYRPICRSVRLLSRVCVCVRVRACVRAFVMLLMVLFIPGRMWLHRRGHAVASSILRSSLCSIPPLFIPSIIFSIIILHLSALFSFRLSPLLLSSSGLTGPILILWPPVLNVQVMPTSQRVNSVKT